LSTVISLIGLPGCGKSTIGKHLGRALATEFVDSDVAIERHLGESIRTYFEREGEPAFRDLEESTIASLLERPGIVLATGGGAVVRPATRAALNAGSVVVYLRSTPEELFRRLRHDSHRPLLQVQDPLARLRALYRERDPLYRSTSHYLIEVGRPSVQTLVNMILMQLELAGVIDASRVPSSTEPKPARSTAGPA
jgi:shikimate kinase